MKNKIKRNTANNARRGRDREEDAGWREIAWGYRLWGEEKSEFDGFIKVHSSKLRSSGIFHFKNRFETRQARAHTNVNEIPFTCPYRHWPFNRSTNSGGRIASEIVRREHHSICLRWVDRKYDLSLGNSNNDQNFIKPIRSLLKFNVEAPLKCFFDRIFKAFGLIDEPAKSG